MHNINSNILCRTALLLCVAVLTTQIAQAVPTIDSTPGSTSPQTTLAPQTAPAPPIPSEIRTAKVVFVQNDSESIDMYSHFVAALNIWGHYTLVDSPSKADIVIVFQYSPLGLTILQPSTNITLYPISDPLGGVYPGNKSKRASLEVENMVSALKQLNGIPLTAQETAAMQPLGFRHNGGFVVLIGILGGLAVGATLALVLHSRAKEK